jgi:hypothetical protein
MPKAADFACFYVTPPYELIAPYEGEPDDEEVDIAKPMPVEKELPSKASSIGSRRKPASMEPMKVTLSSMPDDALIDNPFQNRYLYPLSPGCEYSLISESMPECWSPFPPGLDDISWAQMQHSGLQLASLSVPNPGSMLHGSGMCSPCAWYWKPKSCQNEMECQFCHLCPDGELKARRKAKVASMRNAGIPSKSQIDLGLIGMEAEQLSGNGHILSLSSLL